MTDALRQGAAKSIADALSVLERTYKHAEQVLDVLAAKLQRDLGLERGGGISEYKDEREGKLRLRRFQGCFLAHSREAWKAAEPKADQLRKPILFVCAAVKPRSPSTVGGMIFLTGVIHGFEIRATLKGYKPDQYIPLVIGEHLDKRDPEISNEPAQVDLSTRHVAAKAKYLATRLVDVPDENAVMELAERLVRLWKSK